MIKTIKDHMMKPFEAFLGKDRLDFYRDEYWLVYEAILFALVINSEFFERDISADFPLYEKVILKGIEEGKLDILKNATKNTRKQSNNLFNNIVKYFALSYNITTDQGSSEKESLADVYKIDMAFMQRCIPSYQIKNYFIAERNIHPKALGRKELSQHPSNQDPMETLPAPETIIEHASSAECPVEDLVLPPADSKLLLKQMRKEAGEKKGERWRVFVSNNIKSMVERELKQGCHCLHRDLAERLSDELSNETKNAFGAKDYFAMQTGLPEKIDKAIKQVFYDFDGAYGNVRSRVYRGRYYNEYDYAPCHLHSGK